VETSDRGQSPRVAAWLTDKAIQGLTSKESRHDVYTETVRIDGLELDTASAPKDWPVTLDPGAEVLSVSLRFFLGPGTSGFDPAVDQPELGTPSVSLSQITDISSLEVPDHTHLIVGGVLSGSASGTATSVDLKCAGGESLNQNGAIPVFGNATLGTVAITMRHSDAPISGPWTAVFHRIRGGMSNAIASFQIEV
jgi:hypothetical protein